jgi:3-phenylpropionate/cinnamic acid dioxygenase small subunit
MNNVSADAQREIEQFLIHEADLLDTNRQGEWLDLLHEDFLYRIPVPIAREDPSQSRYDDVMEFANESKSFLAMRFQRIESDFAWAERPAAFVRHFVTNFRMTTIVDDQAWSVRTNVLVIRARQPDPPVLSSAERCDRVERESGHLLLRERVVYLDAEFPNDSQLAAIY